MKPLLHLSWAVVLLAAVPVSAVTDTWDGNSPNAGAGDSNISTALNWADDTAPLSDLVNTDLIFGGITKLAPNFSALFSTDSITFNNTAGAFSLGGQPLTIGTTGIVNNDAQTQTFTGVITVGTAASTFNAVSGPLTFTNAVNLPTGTLTVDGGFATSFINFTGATALTKQGAGTMTWRPDATQSLDVSATAGTINMGADGSPDVFGAGARIAVSGTATLNINESMTLDGALLTRTNGTVTIAAGKTLTAQNGGDVTITGSFTNSTASTIAVTGAGSTLTTTGSLIFNTGTLNVLAGGGLSMGNGVTIGQAGTGTVAVDGSGSSLSGGGLTLASAATGNLTFSNGSTGALGALNVANSVNFATIGTLVVQSGAALTGTLLQIAPLAGLATGTVTINGPGSALTVNTTGATTVGSTSGSIGTLNVQNSGTFTSGTGTTTVNAAGTVAIAGGTFNQNGNMTLNGQMTRDATGVFSLAAGRTLTVQGGGVASFGSVQAFTGTNQVVTGVGSAIVSTGTSALGFNGSATTQVSAGGHIDSAFILSFGGVGGLHTVSVDGAGSQLSTISGSFFGSGGGAANVTFSNNSVGSLGGTAQLGNSSAGSAATVLVQSGADVFSGGLVMASFATAGTSASVTVTGAGTTWTMAGAATTTIGAPSLSTGTLNVQSGGTFNSGTGLTTVDATGTIAISGGTYTSNGNLTLNGGQLTRDGTGNFTLAAGRTLTVQGGGDAIFTGNFDNSTASTITVSGSGSTFSTTSQLTLIGGSTTNVLAGGSISSGTNIFAIGTSSNGNGNGTVTVDGSGSSLAGGPLFVGANGATGSLTFINGSTGAFGSITVDNSGLVGGTSGTLSVQGGASVTGTGLIIAPQTGADSGTVTITGAGSALTLTVGAGVSPIGALSASTGTMNVQDGGTFTTAGGVALNPTGTLNIDGGTVVINGLLQRNGGTVNFTTGALSLLGSNNLTVGTGGLLGTNLTLLADRQLAIGGTTTIDAFKTLTLNGTTFSTGALVNNGTLAFNSGTLAITGAGGFNIGTGALGSNVILGTGSTLQVTQTTTIAGAATLTLNGGVFTAGALNVTGTVRANAGSAGAGSVTNNSGGRIFVGDTLTASGAWTNAAGSQLTLENSGLVSGAGTITNSGLVTGSGMITNAFNNAGGGEVRGEAGRTLYFTGTTGANAGRLNLSGGTLQYTQPFTHAATGQINGHGVLSFPATPVPTAGNPAAGLNNSGAMNLSGGDSLIFGTVAVNGAGKVIASGGATATFFDVFRHSGAEVKASAGSALVFFGQVRGAGSFTGTGTIYMEGGYSPGASPASVSLAPQMVFTESNILTMEIGGLTAGTQHDKLTFTHAAAPQVTWGGTLAVTLINGFAPAAFDAFDIFDFDAARDAGTFASITLPTLTAGLAWDTSQLYTDGTLRVVSTTGLTFAAWATASGLPGALPGGDHDNDGYDNATEFALGLFPPQPGTVEPGGGFFTYAEGQRLRLLFTRPLDRTGLTLKVQASDDLVTWTDLATSINSAPFTGPGFVSENRAHPLAEPGLVEVRDILNTSTTPRRQMRLSITLAP